MKKLSFLFILTFASIIFFGCPKDPDTLESSYWLLTDMIQEEVAVELPETVKITANFEDGKINGKGVCNRYFAGYTLDKKSMKVSDLGSTKMGCGEYANIETSYFTLLGKAESFAIKKNALKIECENGTLKYEQTTAPEEEQK